MADKGYYVFAKSVLCPSGNFGLQGLLSVISIIGPISIISGRHLEHRTACLQTQTQSGQAKVNFCTWLKYKYTVDIYT